MGLGEVLDGAFRLLRADLGALLLVVGVVVVPLQILLAVVQIEAQNELQQLLLGNTEALGRVLEGFVARLPVFLAVSVLQTILMLVVTGAVTRIGAARYLGASEKPFDALRASARKLLPLVGSAILAFLCTVAPAPLAFFLAVVGFASRQFVVAIPALLLGLALVALSVHLYVGFALRVPVVVLEDAGAMSALGRSVRLVRGRWWPTLGTLIVASMVIGVVTFALSGIPGLLSGLFPFEALGVVIGTVGAILATLLTAPAAALIALLVYFNQRIRNEGFDLQLRAAGAPPAAREVAGASAG